VRLGVCALCRQAIRQPHLRPHAGGESPSARTCRASPRSHDRRSGAAERPLPVRTAKVPQPGTPGPVPANSISVNDGAKSMPVDAAKAAPSGGRDFLRH
jgi:hypothetical protein